MNSHTIRRWNELVCEGSYKDTEKYACFSCRRSFTVPVAPFHERTFMIGEPVQWIPDTIGEKYVDIDGLDRTLDGRITGEVVAVLDNGLTYRVKTTELWIRPLVLVNVHRLYPHRTRHANGTAVTVDLTAHPVRSLAGRFHSLEDITE